MNDPDDHLPIPAALCSRQSGDTSTRSDPHATQTEASLARGRKGRFRRETDRGEADGR